MVWFPWQRVYLYRNRRWRHRMPSMSPWNVLQWNVSVLPATHTVNTQKMNVPLLADQTKKCVVCVSELVTIKCNHKWTCGLLLIQMWISGSDQKRNRFNWFWVWIPLVQSSNDEDKSNHGRGGASHSHYSHNEVSLNFTFCCLLSKGTNDAFQSPRTPAFRVVLISGLVALIAFPFIFVMVSCHWLVVVMVSYVSLLSKPQLWTTQCINWWPG